MLRFRTILVLVILWTEYQIIVEWPYILKPIASSHTLCREFHLVDNVKRSSTLISRTIDSSVRLA